MKDITEELDALKTGQEKLDFIEQAAKRYGKVTWTGKLKAVQYFHARLKKVDYEPLPPK